jgi:hypothetical protein
MSMPLRLLTLAFVVLPLFAAAQALPQPVPRSGPTDEQIAKLEAVPQLAALAAGYQQQGDLPRLTKVLERMVALRPQNLPFRYELAAAYAQADDKTRAYDTLLRLQTTGYAGAPEQDARFEKVHGTEVWTYIVENLKANREPFGEGAVAYTLPKGDTMYETIAWDPNAKTLLVGSMRDGSIQRVDAKGRLVPYVAATADNGLWSVLDLAVDAKRDTLWVASTALPFFRNSAPKDLGRAALVKFELSSGKFLARYEAPPSARGQVLSSLAVAPSGVPYAANGATRQIFRVASEKLEMVVANPRLESIRGLAVSGDGKKLYIADYEAGLVGIDLDEGRGFYLAPGPKLSLYGVEGVYWYQNNLVVVQNGFPPARVMRVTLDASGEKIVRAQALEAGQPDMTLPTRGAVAGDDFYFIANSQKTQYDAYGIPRDASKLEGVKLFKTNVRFVWDAPTVPQAPRFAPAPTPTKEGG